MVLLNTLEHIIVQYVKNVFKDLIIIVYGLEIVLDKKILDISYNFYFMLLLVVFINFFHICISIFFKVKDLI